MTLNPHHPEILESENLQWPEPEMPIDEAILKMFKRRVLRLLADTMTTPSQMLNAVRRLEVMKEFPLRVEKQARTLAMAEARIELRRRTLELREAQLRESREKREFAMAKANAKAAAAAATHAKAAERLTAKAKPAPPAGPTSDSLPKAESLDNKPAVPKANSGFKETNPLCDDGPVKSPFIGEMDEAFAPNMSQEP